MNIKLNANAAAMVVNAALIAAIGVACYITSSGLPLFALLFLMGTRTQVCPHCNRKIEDDK